MHSQAYEWKILYQAANTQELIENLFQTSFYGGKWEPILNETGAFIKPVLAQFA